jgi:hypothetical protein
MIPAEDHEYTILRFGGGRSFCYNASVKYGGVASIVGRSGGLLHLPEFRYTMTGLPKHVAYGYYFEAYKLCALIDSGNDHAIFTVDEISTIEGEDKILVRLRNGAFHKFSYNNFNNITKMHKDHLLINKNIVYTCDTDDFTKATMCSVMKMFKRSARKSKKSCLIM